MFVSENSRQDGNSGRRSTDSGQIVTQTHAPIASGGGIFGAESGSILPDAQASGSDKRGVSLWAVLRYKWTILLITVLVAAPAITGVWMLIVPKYSARAEIRVRPIVHDILGQPHMIPLYQNFMNTQVSILRSPTVLQRVLDQKDVQQTRWYKNPPKSLIKNEVRPAMERLRDVLSARPRRGTELVDVSFEARRRRDAELVVNALLDQYVRHIAEMADSTSDKIYKELSERYKSVEKEIEGLEGILIKLRAELGTGVPEELVAMKRVSLEEIEGKYRTVFLDMEVAKWRRRSLYKRYILSMSNTAREKMRRLVACTYEIQECRDELARLSKEFEVNIPKRSTDDERIKAMLEGLRGKLSILNADRKSEYKGFRDSFFRIERRYKTLQARILDNAWRLEVWKDIPVEKVSMASSKKNEVDDSVANDGGPALTTRPAMVQPPYHQDATWHRMDVQVRTLKHRIKSAGSDFKPTHPTMVKLNGELKFAEDMLALRKAQLDEVWRNGLKPQTASTPIISPGSPTAGLPKSPESDHELQLQTVKAEVKLLTYQSGLLFKEVEKQRKEFAATFANAQKLEKENDALRHKRRQFASYRDSLYQMDLKRKAPGSISVMTRAISKSRPSSDRRVVFTAMSLVVGLGLGLGLAFLRANGDQAMYAPDDLPVNAAQGPFLGQLPLVAKSRRNPVEDNPMLAEGMRMVRTALVSRIREDRGSAILVSSANMGAGKTTFAVMLARSFALSGKKILLIDSDLRKRDLTGRFGLADEPGFIESLRHRCVDERSVFSTETRGLNFMPAGRRNDGIELELTANGAFGALIGQARSLYDLIILDSPPILPVADASILSRQVDGTVFVVRQESSNRAAVIDALASLGSAGGKLLGTVFIASQQKALYGGSYYSYGD